MLFNPAAAATNCVRTASVTWTYIASADNPDEVEVGPGVLVLFPVAVVVVVPFCAVEELEQAAIANEADSNAAPATNDRLFIHRSDSRSGPTQSCASPMRGISLTLLPGSVRRVAIRSVAWGDPRRQCGDSTASD